MHNFWHNVWNFTSLKLQVHWLECPVSVLKTITLPEAENIPPKRGFSTKKPNWHYRPAFFLRACGVVKVLEKLLPLYGQTNELLENWNKMFGDLHVFFNLMNYVEPAYLTGRSIHSFQVAFASGRTLLTELVLSLLCSTTMICFFLLPRIDFIVSSNWTKSDAQILSFSCRLHGVPFIVAFLTPTILILVGNIVAFCFIIRSLLTSGNKVTSDKKTTGCQQAKQGIAIMVLLGLTWLFGILAIGDAKMAFQYLFCIFNSLQGLFVFVFFVVLPNGRRQKLQKLRKRKTRSHRRDVQLKKLEENSSQLNKNVYSNTNTSSSGANEPKCQKPSFDYPVFENPLKSVSDLDEEKKIDRVDVILD